MFTWANIAGFFSPCRFSSVVAFLPLFMQLGQGVKATTSGLSTLPLMVGLIVAATVSGRAGDPDRPLQAVHAVRASACCHRDIFC